MARRSEVRQRSGSARGRFLGVTAVAMVLAQASSPVRGGWDRGKGERLAREAEGSPGTRLVLGPGAMLSYRIRTTVVPPRIPFLSSGRTITLESLPEFYVLGLDETGYRVRTKVTSTAEGRTLPVVALDWGDFGLDDRGGRLPAEPGPGSIELANASQLFRDLRNQFPDGSGFEERKWFYFYDSGFGVPRMHVDIRYSERRLDPGTGQVHYRMEITETPEERAQRRGFRASGELVLDGLGRLQRIRAKGEVWKRIVFMRLAAATTYEVDLLSCSDPSRGTQRR